MVALPVKSIFCPPVRVNPLARVTLPPCKQGLNESLTVRWLVEIAPSMQMTCTSLKLLFWFVLVYKNFAQFLVFLSFLQIDFLFITKGLIFWKIRSRDKPNDSRSFLPKTHFLDFLEIFKLDLGQISSNLLKTAFATWQHAFLSIPIRIAFYDIFAQACAEKWPTFLGFSSF